MPIDIKGTALVAAPTLIIGLALGVAAAPTSPQQHAKVEQASTELATMDDFDPVAYARAVLPARDADANLVDFLSPLVNSGASVSTGGNFPRGARIQSVELVGDALGSFSVPTVGTCKDTETATWCEVAATNTGSEPLRFTAFVKYTLDPLVSAEVSR